MNGSYREGVRKRREGHGCVSEKREIQREGESRLRQREVDRER